MSWCISAADEREILMLVRGGCSDCEAARATGHDRLTVRRVREAEGLPPNGAASRKITADDVRRAYARTEQIKAFWLTPSTGKNREEAA